MYESKNKNSLKVDIYRKIRYNLLQRHIYGLTSSFRVLPDFLVIGAKRCGTTSLYEYLGQHPCIKKSSHDNIGFFNDNFHLGIGFYKSFFPTIFEKKKVIQKNKKFMTYDVTSSYVYHEKAPQRLYQHMPNVKLIILLRNPTSRAWSEYNSSLIAKPNLDTFESYIENEFDDIKNYNFLDKVQNNDYNLIDPTKNFLKKGLYVNYLKKWFNLFPRENFLILPTETFAKNENMKKMFEFLNLPYYEIKNLKRMQKVVYKNSLNPETKIKLDKFFESSNKELFELIKQKFAWT